MNVTLREVLVHFRTNPISTLVALLLMLLFGLVLRFIYHIDVEMHRNVLVHDEVQHLQIKDAYLARQLQRSVSELSLFTVNFNNKVDLSTDEMLQLLCRQNAQFARVQWTSVTSAATQDLVCVEGYQADVESSRVMPSVMSGVAFELLGRQQHSLEQQYVRMMLPWVGADGTVEARLVVDYSLADLPDVRSGEQKHGVALTMLLDTQHPWRGAQADHDIARGAARLSRMKIADSGQFQNDHGLYIVHPISISGAQNTGSVNWRLLSWIPPRVLEHHRNNFFVHAGYVLLCFVVLICAMFFYSRRIIRKQADMLTDLNDQRMFLDSLLNSSPDSMLTIGMDRDIQSCNIRTEALFGFRPGELLGRSIEHLLPSDYQTSDQDYRQIYQQLTESGQDYCRQELVGVRSGGDVLPVEVSYCRLQTTGDDRLLLIIREITERKVAERELDNLRLQYFQQEKMSQIGLLMAGILHEVGNPIAAIQGLLDEVLSDDAAQQQTLLLEAHRDNLELVVEQANRIRAISQDVSGFASPNQGERGLLSLNAILQGATKLLGYDKRWQGIDLVLDLDPNLPAFEGVTDQLTQVFMNLLVNAADALSELLDKQPQLQITTHKLAEGLLLVVIKDNGCGIDDESMMHVFDSFYTTKPKGKGTGLGLSICEKLIEEHGGHLELESTLGVGTEVRICFEYGASEMVDSNG
ncbi:MAG: ATP-binding protein [Halopseudomonas sp.]